VKLPGIPSHQPPLAGLAPASPPCLAPASPPPRRCGWGLPGGLRL